MSVVNITNCTRCNLGINKQPNNHLVTGLGNPQADLMIVGESPNEGAAMFNQAFHGSEGDTLKALLRLADIDPNSVYVTYACKCRAWKVQENKYTKETHVVNKQPERDELRACNLFLQQEIQYIRPKVIIALGSGALSTLEGRVCKITERMGVTSIYKGIKDKKNRTYIMPTLHPAYLNKNGGVSTSNGLTTMGAQVVEHLRYAANMRNNPDLFKEHNYTVVDNREKVDRLIAHIKQRRVFTFDIETTGLEFKDIILGVGFGLDIGVSYYIPLLVRPEIGNGLYRFWDDKDITEQEIIMQLKEIFEDTTIQKAAHNAKFDMRGIHKMWGMQVKGLFWDTMCGSYLMNENITHKLKELKNRFIDLLGYEDQWNAETAEGKNAALASFSTITMYCCGDCDATYRLVKEQLAIFTNQPAFYWFMQHFYVPLHNILADMEYHGVLFDVAKSSEMSADYAEQLKKVKDQICGFAGCTFDPESNPQVQRVLFGALGLVHEKVTKTGQQAVDSDVLEELAPHHPVPALIVKYRHLAKMKSTYVDGFAKEVDENNRLHKSINPIGTVTGRMSSKGLMNIPRESTVKSLIIAPKGFKLVCADLSQAEVRCFAHYANEQVLKEAYADDKIDVHCLVASEVIGGSYEEFAAAYKKEQADKMPGKYSELRQAAKGCLREDMRVLCNRGLVQIKEFGISDAPGFVPHKSPIVVVGEDGVFTPSDMAFNNRQDIGRAITTKLGYEFSGTVDHKIQVLCPDGKIQDKKLRDVTTDDYAVLRTEYISATTEVQGCSEELLAAMVLAIPPRPQQQALYIPWKHPAKLNKDWGWLIGFLIGEGSFSANEVKWTQKDSSAFLYEATLIKKLLPTLHVGIRKEKTRDIHTGVISNFQFRDFFRQLGIADGFYNKTIRQRSCHLLKIPEIIFKSSYEVMRGFLQGLWAGEGTITYAKHLTGQVNIKMGLASEQLIKDTQLLMSYFGVLTQRTREFNKKYQRSYFYLRVIDRQSKDNFFKNIGFIGEETKQQKLATALQNTVAANDTVTIPYQEALLKDLYRRLPPTNKATNQRWKDNVQVRLKRKIDLTAGLLQSLPEKYVADVDARFFGGFHFDKIQTITEETFANSYDLSVPKNHHYSANALITHNTTFGLLYGRGTPSIAAEYGIPLEQAEDFMNKFFARFANCKKWIDATHRLVEQTGEVINIFGRHRRIPSIFSSDSDRQAEAKRQAVNSIIQSTASDINNLAVINVYNTIKQQALPAHMLFTVYDSIITETPDDHIDIMKVLLKSQLERQPHPDFTVKLKADLDVYSHAWGVKDKK